MVELHSRLRLASGTALFAAGLVLLALAFTGGSATYETAAVSEDASGATIEPASGSWSKSLGVAGGILLAAGVGIAFLAFSDFGRPSRR